LLALLYTGVEMVKLLAKDSFIKGTQNIKSKIYFFIKMINLN